MHCLCCDSPLALAGLHLQSGQLRLSEGSHAECAAFSPDGRWFVTGSVDGFVEVWDCDRATLHEDLEYQRKVVPAAACLACRMADAAAG